jgi:hypothetical protein
VYAEPRTQLNQDEFYSLRGHFGHVDQPSHYRDTFAAKLSRANTELRTCRSYLSSVINQDDPILRPRRPDYANLAHAQIKLD